MSPLSTQSLFDGNHAPHHIDLAHTMPDIDSRLDTLEHAVNSPPYPAGTVGPEEGLHPVAS